MTIVIQPRSAWGAVPPSSPLQPMPVPTSVVYVHHSASEAHGPDAIKDFQHYHMTVKDMRDIAYSFLVDDDGTCYHGRGFGMAHGGNWGDTNKTSHSICLMGNFMNRKPTAAAENTLVALLQHGKTIGKWGVNDIRAHRDEPGGTPTSCCGDYLYARLPDIRKRAQSATVPPPITVPSEEDDMTIYDLAGRPSLLFTGGRYMKIDSAQSKFLREKEGVVNKGIDAASYDVILTFPPLND